MNDEIEDKQNEIQICNETFKDLNEKLEVLKVSKLESQRKMEALESQLKNIRENVKNATNEHLELEDSVYELEESYRLCRKDVLENSRALGKVEVEIKSLEIKKEKYGSRIKIDSQLLETLKAQLRDKNERLGTEEMALNRLIIENDELSSNLMELKDKIQVCDEKKVSLKKASERNLMKIERNEAEINELVKVEKKLNMSIYSQKERLRGEIRKGLDNFYKLKQLSEIIKELREDIESFEDKIKYQEDRNNDLLDKIKVIEEEKVGINNELNESSNKLEMIKEQKNHLIKELEEKQNSLKNISLKKEATNKCLNDYIYKNGEIKNQIEKAIAAAEKLDKNKTIVDEKIREQKLMLKNYKDEFENIKSEVKKKIVAEEKLRKSFAKSRKQLQIHRESVEIEHKALLEKTDIIKKLEDSIAEHEKRISMLMMKRNDLDLESIKINAKLDELQQASKEIIEDYDAGCLENNLLETSIKDCEKEVESLKIKLENETANCLRMEELNESIKNDLKKKNKLIREKFELIENYQKKSQSLKLELETNRKDIQVIEEKILDKEAKIKTLEKCIHRVEKACYDSGNEVNDLSKILAEKDILVEKLILDFKQKKREANVFASQTNQLFFDSFKKELNSLTSNKIKGFNIYLGDDFQFNLDQTSTLSSIIISFTKYMMDLDLKNEFECFFFEKRSRRGLEFVFEVQSKHDDFISNIEDKLTSKIWHLKNHFRKNGVNINFKKVMTPSNVSKVILEVVSLNHLEERVSVASL